MIFHMSYVIPAPRQARIIRLLLARIQYVPPSWIPAFAGMTVFGLIAPEHGKQFMLPRRPCGRLTAEAQRTVKKILKSP
ncbi:MAG: hypothetical protein JWN23_2598 [Rhodocyclales bacterium]|nr:hypothetical protein [Rhodocyclales bacterium]